MPWNIHEYGTRMFLLVYLSVTIVCIVDIIYPSIFMDTLVITAVFSVLALSFVTNSKAMLAYAFGIYIFLGQLITAYFVGFGLWMSEIDRIGSPNGVVGLIAILFLISLFLFVTVYGKNNLAMQGGYIVIRKYTKDQVSLIYLIVILQTFLMLVMAFLYSTPVLLGINRVEYFLSIPKLFNYLRPLIYISLLFLISYFLTSGSKVAKCWIIFLVCSCFFFFGEKFTAFIVVLTIFSICMSAKQKFRLLTFKMMLLALLCVFILFLFIYYSYKDNSYGPLVSILNRVAQQPQISWSLMNDDFKWMSGVVNWRSVGEAKELVCYRYAPPIFCGEHYGGNRNLTGYYPAVYILRIGMLPAVILTCVLSVFLAILARSLTNAVFKNRLVVSAFYFWAYLSLQGLSYGLAGFGIAATLSLLVFIFIYCYEALSRAGRDRRSGHYEPLNEKNS